MTVILQPPACLELARAFRMLLKAFRTLRPCTLNLFNSSSHAFLLLVKQAFYSLQIKRFEKKNHHNNNMRRLTGAAVANGATPASSTYGTPNRGTPAPSPAKGQHRLIIHLRLTLNTGRWESRVPLALDWGRRLLGAPEH